MKVNKITMMIERFDCDTDRLYADVKKCVLQGELTEYFQEKFDLWADLCESDELKRDHQRLLLMSTVFPLRVLLSLSENKNDSGIAYGCHVDLGIGEEPDECVIGSGKNWECVFAVHGMKKEDCVYWKAYNKSEYE